MGIIQLILYFIGEIYVIFSVTYCYSKLTLKESDINILKKISIIIISAILLLINNIYNFTEIKLIVSFVIMFLVNKLYYKDTIRISIQNSILFSIIGTILELIFTMLLLKNMKNLEYLNTHATIVKFIFTCFIMSLTNLLYKIKITNKILRKINSLLRHIFSIEVLLLIILIILNMIGFRLSIKMNDAYTIISVITIMIYLTMTIVLIIKNKTTIKKLETKNKELTNSYKSYSEALDQFRELKHNLKNDLFSMKSVLPEEKQIHLNALIMKYNHKYEWLNQLSNIPEGLEGIIFLKKQEAEKEKIIFLVNYNSKNIIKDKDFLDICEVLGIILDNAIEASKDINKKMIVLNVKDDDNKIIINVTNLFNNTLNVDKLGDKNYSTKNRKSGLGLNYIKNLNNNNIIVNIKIINNLFITKLIYKSELKKNY